MIRACNTLSIPVYATTQSASRLGPSQSVRAFHIHVFSPLLLAHPLLSSLLRTQQPAPLHNRQNRLLHARA